MRLLERILTKPVASVASSEQRMNDRFPVGEHSPVSVALRLLPHDARGRPVGFNLDRDGRYWPGRLADVSRKGARVVVAPEAGAANGEAGRLCIGIGDEELIIDCVVAHVRSADGSLHCGLDFGTLAPEVQKLWLMLVEPFAVAAAMELVNPARVPPTSPEYRLEVYEGPSRTKLTIWRLATNRAIHAFELRIGTFAVHWTSGMPEIGVAVADQGAVHLTEHQRQEVIWLFCLIVTSLDKRVAPDVRHFLTSIVRQ